MSDNVEPLPIEAEALVLSVLETRVKQRQNDVKAQFSARYNAGSRETFFSPVDGRELGMVYRTNPKATWSVTDWDALREHLADSEDAWEQVVSVLLPNGQWQEMDEADELYRIVAEHAPHLCGEPEQRLRSVVVGDLVSQSAKDGQAVAPGITRNKGPGALTVKPDGNAYAVVTAMVDAGVIDWQGRRVLEQGTEEAS